MGNSGKDRNYVSMWFWMFAMLVMALPCIGVVMMLVWAFTGENASRKNYFRAIIAWYGLFFAVWGGLLACGFWPGIHQCIGGWLQQLQAWWQHWK